MGAWGVKGLESDPGLDVLSEFSDYCLNHSTVVIDEVIGQFKIDGLLAQDDNESSLFYDYTIIVLAELLVDYSNDSEIVLQNDNKETKNITQLSYSQASLRYIIDHLVDIIEPNSETHELYLLWEESDNFQEWKEHIDLLVVKLEELKGI